MQTKEQTKVFKLNITTKSGRKHGPISTSYSGLIGPMLDIYLFREFNLRPLTEEERHTLARYDELLIPLKNDGAILLEIEERELK